MPKNFYGLLCKPLHAGRMPGEQVRFKQAFFPYHGVLAAKRKE